MTRKPWAEKALKLAEDALPNEGSIAAAMLKRVQYDDFMDYISPRNYADGITEERRATIARIRQMLKDCGCLNPHIEATFDQAGKR